MTKDEIIKLAREAGFVVVAAHKTEVALAEAYRCGVEAGAAAEREACAKLCDDLDDDLPDGLAGWQFAAAIRARSQA